MGIGNLENVLHGVRRRPRAPTRELYFDSTPLRHAAAYARLACFGDDSSNYFWKLGAARTIMRLARTDPAGLARQSRAADGRRPARAVLLDGAPQGDLRALPDAAADTR